MDRDAGANGFNANRDLDALKICSRCIYDERIADISFDQNGVCNYCRMVDAIADEYKTGTEGGRETLDALISRIKRDGAGKRYDCVVGISGGTDSSYLMLKAVQWGLRPLAVHYDNTWNSAIATENIRKILAGLNIDLYTHVVDNKESDDIFHSFFLAGVPELDGPTDIALAQVLYKAASEHGLSYVLEGHSYKTEGISPLGTFYIDGRYIRSVHQQFGSLPMRTFPNMSFLDFMKWTLVKRIRKIRPYWYIDYSKEAAREVLEQRFGWQYYGGHHLENRMTAFFHSYYLPRKFGIDCRHNSLSASVREGRMTRSEALDAYRQPPYIEPNLVEYFKKRLCISDAEFERVMDGPRCTFRDFKTYKTLFERLRPLFFVLAKMQLVPWSFYLKYTSGKQAQA